MSDLNFELEQLRQVAEASAKAGYKLGKFRDYMRPGVVLALIAALHEYRCRYGPAGTSAEHQTVSEQVLAKALAACRG